MTSRYCARRVMAVAGASGGHLFPALAFLETVRQRHEQVSSWLVVPARCACRVDAEASGATLVPLEVEPVRREFNRRAVRGLAKFCLSFVRAARHISSVKPEVVVGFGSIVSVPLVIMAWLFRCRTAIHEQNVVPGAANRLLAYFADTIAVSFPESRERFPGNGSKVVVTGNPLRGIMRRMDRQEALRRFNLKGDRFILLVLGGSQGAHALNRACVQACALPGLRGRVQVVHAAGKEDAREVEAGYAAAGVEAVVREFITDMPAAYCSADLCISRSGAGAVTELAYFGVPSILVPYPYAKAHQSFNAQVLVSRKAALLCAERDLSAEALASLIEGLIDAPQRLAQMRAGCAHAVPEHAADNLVKEVLYE
jgi:UDP-N-acetylglucosamine--N-acetylmuramyl-(pentapeptide) pyrophosphoryl-undecaprenol N-acetylglucosamine transferase